MKQILFVGMLFISGCAVQARADNTVDVVRLCKAANIDAALEADASGVKVPSKAAQEGEICIAYVNAVVGGYSIGSVTAENYITGFMANHLAHMTSDDKSAIDDMQGAVLSVTKSNTYSLCLPTSPARDVYPRAVAAYIEDQKISSYPTPALLVVWAVQAKFGAVSESCKSS